VKHTAAVVLALILACAAALSVDAQAGETIWIETAATEYQAGETVIVTVNAISGTPIQGFTFQIRYDPACLQPLNAASPIPGMNGLLLPQSPGLVDATFASTTPQMANGVLAEVQFMALAGCQANLVLESAALATRNESGFAAPVTAVALGEKNLALNVSGDRVGSQSTPSLVGTPLPLGFETSSAPKTSIWAIIALPIILLLGGLVFFRKKIFRV